MFEQSISSPKCKLLYYIFTDAETCVYPLPYSIYEAGDFSYYSAPGAAVAGTAKKAEYTITEVDASCTYGKLKSGAGWIKLTGVEQRVGEKQVNYREAVAKNADTVYGAIVEVGCEHGSGASTLEEIIKKRVTTYNDSVRIVMAMSGLIAEGAKFGHTAKDGKSGATKKTPEAAIKGLENLIPGTADVVKVGKKFDELSAEYQNEGNIYIQDSNACISAGDGYIYSTNQGAAQMKDGRYVLTKVKSGYLFKVPNEKILINFR